MELASAGDELTLDYWPKIYRQLKREAILVGDEAAAK
jgi:hypothetical protein